ncbi:MAG: DUF4105 domain-containing protein [Paludibacter sp.]|jgi:hypothetical protein
MSLSERAEISLLVSSPSDSEFFTMFGHASLRINDPGLGIDYVFNYGIFDHPSAFINTFYLLKGNLHSELYAVTTHEFVEAVHQNGRKLTAYILNLMPDEKEDVWQNLMRDAQTDQRYYTYDIFKKNCVTLPRNLLENNVQTIVYQQEEESRYYTFRILGNQYLEHYPWVNFATDIFFGVGVDVVLNERDADFLPDRLAQAFVKASIVDQMGDKRPLVIKEDVLLEEVKSQSSKTLITPALVSYILLFLVVLLSVGELVKKKYFRWFDSLLFGVVGLIGMVLFLTNTVFAQWYTCPNWMLIWLHPLHLVAAILILFHRFDQIIYYYHVANAVVITFMLVLIFFLPQHFISFFSLIACLWIRSVIGIYKFKVQIS